MSAFGFVCRHLGLHQVLEAFLEHPWNHFETLGHLGLPGAIGSHLEVFLMYLEPLEAVWNIFGCHSLVASCSPTRNLLRPTCVEMDGGEGERTGE